MLPAMDVFDFSAGFAEADQGNQQLVAPGNVGNAVDVQQPQRHRSAAATIKTTCLKGKVGKGRHGQTLERGMLALHMRSSKALKRQHQQVNCIVDALQGATFKKHGKSFRIQAKGNLARGVVISLSQCRQRGNQHQRKIQFSQFLEASYVRASSNNVAVAAALDIDPSTVARLQKTVASLSLCCQARVLGKLAEYCRDHPPVVAFRQLVFVSFFLCGGVQGVRRRSLLSESSGTSSGTRRLFSACSHLQAATCRYVPHGPFV